MKQNLYKTVAKWDEHIGHLLCFKKAPPGRLEGVSIQDELAVVIVWVRSNDKQSCHFAEDIVFCECEKEKLQ